MEIRKNKKKMGKNKENKKKIRKNRKKYGN